MTHSEVENVSGIVGDFKVRVRKKARFVDETLCTGCGICVEKCPWKKIPDEFEFGLSNRPAIHFHYDQAVPKVPVIDTEHCAYFKNGKCKACEKFCQRDAINFNQQDEVAEIDVGAIILATGFKDFDPVVTPRYGYTEFENVLTSMEFERLVNTGGPTSGRVLMSNGERPKRVAIIHCVGSRGDQNDYCSRACCMYSLKLAHLVREMVGADVVEFYRDMRAFGKSYEAFFEKVSSEQVEFFRYDGELLVIEEEDTLIVKAQDVFTGNFEAVQVDMVILSTGMEPQSDQKQMASRFGISISPDGFFMEKHPKLAPVETATDGVFLAGTCQGPKDIPDSVAHGSAAAASALSLMDAGNVVLEPFTAYIDSEKCSACQVCLNACPYHAIDLVSLNGHRYSKVNEVICKGCGTCVAACPAGAAMQNGFQDGQILVEIEGLLRTGLVMEAVE